MNDDLYLTNNSELLRKQKVKTILLDDKDFELQMMFYSEDDNDLIVAYTLLSSVGSYGRVIRYSGVALKEKWSTRILGCNLSMPLIENGLFVVTSNYILKINPDNGKIIWQTDITDISGKYNIFYFDVITKEGKYLLLHEKQFKKIRKSIILKVDDTTGRVIEIITNPRRFTQSGHDK